MATPKKSSKPAKSETSKDKSADKPAHVAPVVNLTNAAQSAAMLLAARRNRAAAEAGADDSAGNVSAAAFKKLKDGLGQPQHAATSPLAGLNKSPKPTGVAGYNRPGGHHQNATANVARTGVPRRTSGG